MFHTFLLFITLVDSCTNIGVTNCAHFTNVDDQGNVLCMCRPGYRVDLSNSSNCIGEYTLHIMRLIMMHTCM